MVRICHVLWLQLLMVGFLRSLGKLNITQRTAKDSPCTLPPQQIRPLWASQRKSLAEADRLYGPTKYGVGKKYAALPSEVPVLVPTGTSTSRSWSLPLHWQRELLDCWRSYLIYDIFEGIMVAPTPSTC